MDIPLAALRALRVVAETGSVTLAAKALGYTQSAVSRQLAAAELEAGHKLFTRGRGPGGMRPTREGQILLRHAAAAVHAMETAAAEINNTGPAARALQLGCIPIAGVSLLGPVLARLAVAHPALRVATRQGPTAALLRSVRSQGLDLALVTDGPPDGDDPPLTVVPALETTLMVAVAAEGKFQGRDEVAMAELAGEPWIAGLATSTDPQLGVWPHLTGRPRIAHRTGDWLAKLRLVAAGAGVTTVPGPYVAALVRGVHTVRVTGSPQEVRRVSAVHLPGNTTRGVRAVLDAILIAADELDANVL
jgi:DNA-binding transcriptional LysR family regulator